jgi:hypothetical protein
LLNQSEIRIRRLAAGVRPPPCSAAPPRFRASHGS